MCEFKAFKFARLFINYSVRFMLFLNLFVSVLIEIILNEKKVMLVLINNDPRSFFFFKLIKIELFLQYKIDVNFLKFKISKNYPIFQRINLLINHDNFIFNNFF